MAKLSQLLLYDSDPNGLETLTYVFEKDGCTVSATGDAETVRELLQRTGSSLLLIALRDPEQTGLDLIHALTGNPRTRNIACLVIGPPTSRGAALKAGAFGYLSSPVFVRDVVDASKLVAAATVPGSRPSPDTEVAIKLAEIGGVYYLVRALAACGRSSAVEIQRGPRRGELRFIDGNLSSVQVGGLLGLSALHQLLLWEDADLRLKFRNVVRRGGQLSLKNEELIEECDRFLRDFAHEIRDLGVARTIYRPSGRAVQPTAALPSEVVPLLRLFDGERDLARILDDSPFRMFDTLRIARQFIAAGAVLADPPARVASPEPPASGGPAALDPWFERNLHRPASLTVDGGPGRSAQAAPAAPAANDGGGRPSSPFIKIVNSGGHPDRPSGLPSLATAGAKRSRTRTITEREKAIEIPKAEDERARNLSLAPARGEIQATPLAPKKVDRQAKPSGPSVLVEVALPPPPLTATEPSREQAKEPSQNPSPPAIVPSPMTPPPLTVGGPASLKKNAGVPAHHRSRTPSNSFNAIEADFFSREADLYKGDSAVETFDDLERSSVVARTPEAARKPRPTPRKR